MAVDSELASFRIVVVGGGIAGLATAIAMRGPGRDITVLEKSRMNREVGALISLQPNAQKIVDSWNIKPFLSDAKPVVDKAFRIMDTTGQIHLDLNLDSAAKYGADRIVYHRQDLHEALKRAATSNALPGPPATVITSAKVIACDCEAGIVTTEDGTTYHGDLVIGADGIHSAIRESVLPPEARKKAQPTGLSAYRLLVNVKDISPLDVSPDTFDLQNPATTLIMGHSRRVIMGPGRDGTCLGLVCLVPDELMNEESDGNSWTSPGSLCELLQSFSEFPDWVRKILEAAAEDEIALWQLRDIDALPTWTKGRSVIIGDAAHAMLPTQGQGASQSIEDAEGLQAFFADISGRSTAEQVHARLEEFFRSRYDRASLIQTYSRQQARPATDKGSTAIKLNPAEFMDYNCKYAGARAWLASQTTVVA